MTREEKLQAIREKCVAANPERFECSMVAGDDCNTYRLSDVLLVITKLDRHNTSLKLAEMGGTYVYWNFGDLVENLCTVMWNLRQDDLTAQSDETIDFIHSLLCV